MVADLCNADKPADKTGPARMQLLCQSAGRRMQGQRSPPMGHSRVRHIPTSHSPGTHGRAIVRARFSQASYAKLHVAILAGCVTLPITKTKERNMTFNHADQIEAFLTANAALLSTKA